MGGLRFAGGRETRELAEKPIRERPGSVLRFAVPRKTGVPFTEIGPDSAMITGPERAGIEAGSR